MKNIYITIIESTVDKVYKLIGGNWVEMVNPLGFSAGLAELLSTDIFNSTYYFLSNDTPPTEANFLIEARNATSDTTSDKLTPILEDDYVEFANIIQLEFTTPI